MQNMRSDVTVSDLLTADEMLSPPEAVSATELPDRPGQIGQPGQPGKSGKPGQPGQPWMQWMQWWQQESGEMSVETCTIRWSQEISRAYSGAQVRWARITGRRWEFLGGNSPDITFSSVRMEVSKNIGLCLSNAGAIDRRELDDLKDNIGQSIDRLM